jgi:hypothetical protein
MVEYRVIPTSSSLSVLESTLNNLAKQDWRLKCTIPNGVILERFDHKPDTPQYIPPKSFQEALNNLAGRDK